jgi:hypothetical protein
MRANHRADGPFLRVRVWRAPLQDAGLFSIVTGKLHQAGTISVRPARRVVKISSHAAAVSWVTDGSFVTLIMCGYSASSIFEFATGSSSGEIQVDSRPSLNRANFPGRNSELKNWLSAKKQQPPKGPISVKVQACSGRRSCSYHNAQIHGTQLPENGTEHRLG